MLIDTKKTVSITSANQNFTQLLKQVDKLKNIVIMKRNKPKYIILDFASYEELFDRLLLTKSNEIMDKYDHVFKELAK